MPNRQRTFLVCCFLFFVFRTHHPPPHDFGLRHRPYSAFCRLTVTEREGTFNKNKNKSESSDNVWSMIGFLYVRGVHVGRRKPGQGVWAAQKGSLERTESKTGLVKKGPETRPTPPPTPTVAESDPKPSGRVGLKAR